MTVVITGATGQVGLHLIDALLARGRRVRAMVLPSDRGLDGRDVEVVRGDVRDSDSVRRAFEGAEVVFHLAAIVSTRSDAGPMLWSVNLGGARNAARAAREAGVRRFVHFSSIVAFDPHPKHLPLDERRPRVRGPEHAPYSLSKALGEAAVRREIERGLDAVIVHPTVIVGPHETHHEGIVQNLIGAHHAGRLPAIVEGGFNLVDVLDVVNGAIAASERGRTGESYILGGRWYTVAELLGIASSLNGRRAPRIEVPMWMARAALPFVQVGSRIARAKPMFNGEELNQIRGNPDIRIDKASTELGYDPRPIEDSLRRVYAWLGA
jgi:dihydroflavonol-4-reductase